MRLGELLGAHQDNSLTDSHRRCRIHGCGGSAAIDQEVVMDSTSTGIEQLLVRTPEKLEPRRLMMDLDGFTNLPKLF